MIGDIQSLLRAFETNPRLAALRHEWWMDGYNTRAEEDAAWRAENQGGTPSARAERLLRSELGQDPKPVLALIAAAAADDISESTLRRVKDALGIGQIWRGRVSFWELPTDVAARRETVASKAVKAVSSGG